MPIKEIILNPQDYRDDNRPFGGFLKQEASDVIGDIGFDVVKVDRIHTGNAVFNRFLNDQTGLLKQILGFPQIDKSARNNVRRLSELAGLGIESGDDDKHSIIS